MVLDITLFRTPDTLESIKKSHDDRFGDTNTVDLIVEHDEFYRKLLFKKNEFAKIENLIKKIIGSRQKLLKQKKNDTESKTELKTEDVDFESLPVDIRIKLKILNSPLLDTTPDKLVNADLEKLTNDQLVFISGWCKEEKDQIEKRSHTYLAMRNYLLKEIGNILHESVPVGKDESFNTIVRLSEDFEKPSDKTLSHYELIKLINGVDYKAGSRVAGNRGYYLLDSCVYLAQALQAYALKKLGDKDFIPVQTPFFMNESVMQDVAQLSQFDEELYQIDHDDSNKKYLIATSEQPLTALHAGEKLSAKTLPLKYAGLSTCFRKEAGRHGKDTSGIFRVHQFDKVEQFVICSNNLGSWEHLESMLNNSTEFLDDLKIKYRVVNVASGELNLAAAKKYDVEGWFPGSQTYRELVSCSNCTDYHSRNLGIKHTSSEPEGAYVHMLNATMCAITRMICIVLETYQTDKGIVVPTVLKQYMPEKYKDMIPFK